MNKRKSQMPAKGSVASYIAAQISLSGKSQVEISDEIGFETPNLVTMIKQGKTKLPLTKVKAFARAIGVDSLHLLRITMLEYMPEVWEVIEASIERELISESEKDLIMLYRTYSEQFPLTLDAEIKEDIEAVLEKHLRKRQLFA